MLWKRHQQRTFKSTESTIAFGYSKQLDLDQQTAFKILTATVINSYVQDSIQQTKSENNQEAIETMTESSRLLRQLSQECQRDGRTLRMFLTGPASAGKCK